MLLLDFFPVDPFRPCSDPISNDYKTLSYIFMLGILSLSLSLSLAGFKGACSQDVAPSVAVVSPGVFPTRSRPRLAAPRDPPAAGSNIGGTSSPHFTGGLRHASALYLVQFGSPRVLVALAGGLPAYPYSHAWISSGSLVARARYVLETHCLRPATRRTQLTAWPIVPVNYDPIAHLNLLFPQPSSAASVSRVSQAVQHHKDGLSKDISNLELTQAYGPESSLERMQAAKEELAQLFSKVESVRLKAAETERNITSMTADIKRLDGTKRNLTRSMTALKRLQMLTTAYDQLRSLAKTRQYRECAGLLQAVIQLMKHFNSYRSIEQIAALSRGVSDLQRELLEQICEDFEIAFAKGEVSTRRGTLIEACLVMDALGEAARSRLIAWYVNTELREYRQVFRGNDEAGSLDNIGRRYSWFKRMMKTHEEEHAAIFPSHWRVNEALATAFCDGTRDDFHGILERSVRRVDSNKIDVNLLLSCLQETLDFEQALERRFASEPRASIDTLSSLEDRAHGFNGSISVAFEPYLSLWVESRDKELAAMIPRYRSQPLIPPDEEFSPQAVISSAIELFHFYKITLSQCAKLSTSERLLDLSRTFAKYLDEYAQQVLLHFLQATPQQSPPLHDIILVLNTADFWHINTTQLEENIRRRIDPELASRVELSSQSDAFLGVASAAVIALVRDVANSCEPVWREMRNTNWSTMDSVGDQSSYVGELLKHINSRAEEILGIMHKAQYARAFCDNLVEHIATAYINNVIQCRPISEVGAEQVCCSSLPEATRIDDSLRHRCS